jgi:toxin HigB-1
LLDPAAKIDDLAAARVNRLELLKGDQAGRHSIRVNDQYRVMFRWENGNAYEARVEDYH